MWDSDAVGHAQHAAVRLEQAWTRWRHRHGLADASADPVASYVGYSLAEPMGEPRVVIGVDAVEAEVLADFLDRLDAWDDGTRTRASGDVEPADARWSPVGRDGLGSDRSASVRIPAPALSADLQPAPVDATSASAAGGGRRSGWSGGIAAELAGWSSGELPGQATQQLAAWAATVTSDHDRAAAIPSPAARWK